jgi:hypothetical protein
VAEQSRFLERRAVQGMVLTLDDQRGALIMLVAERRMWSAFWIKAERARLGFHEVARRYLIRGESVCAVIYKSLPPGNYTIKDPHWARGLQVAVTAGRVRSVDLRSRSAPAHAGARLGDR